MGRSYDVNPAFSEGQTSLFVQGQSDTHRPIREILHRTPGCSLTSSGLLALQARLYTSKSRHLRLYLGSSAVCKTSHTTQRAYQGRRAQQPTRTGTTHPPPPAYLPKVPVHCGSAGCSGRHLSRALFLHHCRGRAWLSAPALHRDGWAVSSSGSASGKQAL